MSILHEPAGPANPPLSAARLARGLKRTLSYWLETEVHVYGFSIAANVMLAFFPFMIVMVSLCRHLLQWPEAERAIYVALKDYFPGQLGQYIPIRLSEVVSRRGPIQITSLLLLFFTANGVFMPLEVALNRVWRIQANRTFLRNQLISMALILGCGGLIFASTLMTAANQQLLRGFMNPNAQFFALAATVAFKIAAVPTTILCVLLVYWLLPNAKVPLNRIFPASIIIGLLLEVLKYLAFASWPWLQPKLESEYGVFYVSVSIILYSFVASMLFLAGAEWASRPHPETLPPVID